MWVEDGVEGRSVNAAGAAHFQGSAFTCNKHIHVNGNYRGNLCFPGKPHLFPRQPSQACFFLT